MFMQGRYGMDSLNGCILIVAGILWLVNLFVRPLVPSLVLWATESIRKFKERKEYKYLKCPFCKAQLRVRNQKGDHGVRCPKCRKEFRVKI